MTETTLLANYATSKDAEAFAELVTRYQRLIFATCRRVLHEPQDVDDAVQETFLRLATSAGELHSNVGAWLHRCAVRVSIDLNRRRTARKRHESAAAADVPVAGEDSQRQLAELREQLDAALEKLDPEQRELIVQRFFVGRQQTEIAQEAGVAPSTVSHRLDRAIEALRGQLSASKGVLAAAGGATLAGLLEAEHAAAAVPAQLTGNLMKIGLTGVTAPAAAAAGAVVGASIFATLGAKLAIAAAALMLLAGGTWVWKTKHAPQLPQAPIAQAAAPLKVSAITTGVTADAAIIAAASPPQWTAASTTQPAVLSGRIVDQQGKPVANANVDIGGQATKTDADGNYSFRTVRAAAEYRISVVADGFLPIEPYVSNEPGLQLSPKSQARRDLVLQRGATVQVTVNDLIENPFAGVDVDICPNDRESRGRGHQRKQTDASGRVSFTVGASKVAYVVSATKADYEPTHAMVTIDAAEQKKDATLQILPGTPIKGLAICKDGKPASGWTVSAYPEWWMANYIPRQATIDQNGNFTLTEVGPGTYRLMVWKKHSGQDVATLKFPPASQPFRLDLPYASPSSLVKLDGKVHITGTQPGYISVQAMGEADQGWHSDQVKFTGRTPRGKGATQPAGINGTFTLDDLTPGVYRITFESPEIENKVLERVTVPGDLPVVELNASGKPRLKGKVVDSATGKPVAQFAVRARKLETVGNGPNYTQEDRWFQVSEPGGSFDLELVGPGVYQAQASADGYAWAWSEKTTIDVKGKGPPVQVKLNAGGTLSGRVVDPAGKAVAGAKVIPLSMAQTPNIRGDKQFLGDAGSVTTDQQGHFEIAHLSAGDESIKVVRDGFAPAVASDFKITDGKTTDAGAVPLQTGGTVEGTVYNDKGQPSAGVTLQFNDDTAYNGSNQEQAGRVATANTDTDGHYRAEHLPVDQVIYVGLVDRWNSMGVVRRAVRPMEAKTSKLDFGGKTPIKGRLIIDGKPAAATRVELSVQSEYFGVVMVQTTTGADGSFTFFGPPPGKYTLFYMLKDERSNFVQLRDVEIKSEPMDLGDVTADVGEAVLTIDSDDPAAMKKIRWVNALVDDPTQMWPRGIGQFAADPQTPGKWKGSHLPAGKLRAMVYSSEENGVSFSVPFERKPGAAQTMVSLHIPNSTAEVSVKLVGTIPGVEEAPTSRYAMLRSTDRNVSVGVRTKGDESATIKAPPGKYEVVDAMNNQPRTDIPLVELKAGANPPLTIDTGGTGAARPRRIEVSVWTSDGLPMIGTGIALADAQGKAISDGRPGQFGMVFALAAGHYRATVERAGGAPFVHEFDVSPQKVQSWKESSVYIVLP